MEYTNEDYCKAESKSRGLDDYFQAVLKYHTSRDVGIREKVRKDYRTYVRYFHEDTGEKMRAELKATLNSAASGAGTVGGWLQCERETFDMMMRTMNECKGEICEVGTWGSMEERWKKEDAERHAEIAAEDAARTKMGFQKGLVWHALVTEEKIDSRVVCAIEKLCRGDGCNEVRAALRGRLEEDGVEAVFELMSMLTVCRHVEEGSNVMVDKFKEDIKSVWRRIESSLMDENAEVEEKTEDSGVSWLVGRITEGRYKELKRREAERKRRERKKVRVKKPQQRGNDSKQQTPTGGGERAKCGHAGERVGDDGVDSVKVGQAEADREKVG